MGVWTVAGVVVGVAALVVLAVLLVVRRQREAPPAATARPSSPPRRPSKPAPAPERLAPHRIVLAADGVPVVDVARTRAADAATSGEALEAPRLAGLLAPVARESMGLMELPGSDRCRVSIRVEVARAMNAGILPLLLSKSPVAPIVGEGVETLAAEPAGLAALGVAAWEAGCAERVRRSLGSLDGRLSLLGGGAQDAVPAIRARRSDLLELVRRILTGETDRQPGIGRLQEVESSSRARTDELLRQVGGLSTSGKDAALAMRQVGGALLLVVAVRAAAVEVRAVLQHNPDLALTKLVELEGLAAKIAGIVSARRTADVEDAVLELLAHGKELEGMLRASRERLFARELELQLEVGPDGTLRRVFLGA